MDTKVTVCAWSYVEYNYCARVDTRSYHCCIPDWFMTKSPELNCWGCYIDFLNALERENLVIAVTYIRYRSLVIVCAWRQLLWKVCHSQLSLLHTPGGRQSKTPILSRGEEKKYVRNSFRLPFVSTLATNGNQKNTVSIDFWSVFVNCW